MSLEKKLLARLTDAAAITEVWDLGVRAEVFEEPLYSAIFNFITDYWLSSQMKSAPTPFALSQEFPGYTPTEDADETIDWLAHKLQQRHVTNRLQDMLREAAKNSTVDPIGSLKALHAAAYAAAEDVAPRNLRSDMSNVEARRERYARRLDHPHGGIGVPFGIDLLDTHTGGILPGELAVVGAFSSVGKTMFMLHAAAQALRKGHRPLVYTLEMSITECEDRIDAFYSGVSYNRLLRSHLTVDEGRRLQDAQDELSGRVFVERPNEGERTVASLCARARQIGADYLFIDQLSFMEPGVKVMSLKEHHSVIVKQLKTEISRPGLELPCLLVAQANRDSLKDGLSLASFSNATEIEATVDMAVGLHRTQDMRNNRCMQLDILKSRRSDTASYLLRWDLTERTDISLLEQING